VYLVLSLKPSATHGLMEGVNVEDDSWEERYRTFKPSWPIVNCLIAEVPLSKGSTLNNENSIEGQRNGK